MISSQATKMKIDPDLKACLAELPNVRYCELSPTMKPNAFVCITDGDVLIFHENGGCLFDKMSNFAADAAPFCD